MQSTPEEMHALQRATQELEPPLAALESRLSALGLSLRERDAERIEAEATALHRALAAAIDSFGRAARQGVVPSAMRNRLMTAGAQVAAQREALARATASLDRAIDVLFPSAVSGVYSAHGGGDKAHNQGSAQA
jgi:hypothetical protein